MVAVNMIMLNAISLLLGAAYSHLIESCDDPNNPESSCYDRCDPDPPEDNIDIQGIPTNDPNLNILLNLSWPRKDVSWYLDASRVLLENPRRYHAISHLVQDVQEFIDENRLDSIAQLLKRDNTEDIRNALAAGERELAQKDALELNIKETGITFDPDAPSITHQLSSRRTDPISIILARSGFIAGSATLNFIQALKIPTVATVGLSLLGPLFNNEATGGCTNPEIPWRTLNGSCNNLNNPTWGRAFTLLRRDLKADYSDGVKKFRKAVNGSDLPSARFVSSVVNVIPERNEMSPTFSILHMTFGQFIDHDLTSTPIFRGPEGSTIKCCNVHYTDPRCAPIHIPLKDTFYERFDQTCMEFVRSAPGSLHLGPWQQINQLTAYLDGSVVYGVKLSDTIALRTFRDGLLKGQIPNPDQWLLPPDKNDFDGCNRESRIRMGEYCFKAGDGRVNEQIQLTFLQTLFAREHNRVAGKLKGLNPLWDDERLFEEARRIIGAELQQVTYSEFLPSVIGPALMKKLNLYPLRGNKQTTDYNGTLNADISNVFSTAAFRFGHSLVADELTYENKFGEVTPNELSTLFFNPFYLYQRDAVCDVGRGSIVQAENKMDRFFTLEIAGKLFRGSLPYGLDLFALNIQRGRDHGLPPYNKWRKFCGLKEAQDFQDLLPQMDQTTIFKLGATYGNVNDIDVYVGGVSEKPIPGALLGPTFACLVANQFHRIKMGDRYWFEYKNGPGAFTKSQMRQLHKVTLARIMCNNLPELKKVQRKALKNPSSDNPMKPCKNIPWYNLEPWNDNYIEEDCTEQFNPPTALVEFLRPQAQPQPQPQPPQPPSEEFGFHDYFY